MDLGYDFAGDEQSGDYEIDLTSVHPYVGWKMLGMDMWATAGYGWGDLTITSDDPGWDPGGSPVWSNDGDIVMLLDRHGRVVDHWRYEGG